MDFSFSRFLINTNQGWFVKPVFIGLRSPVGGHSATLHSMNIIRSWKRIVVVGCSHGQYANPDATAAVLLFCEQFKPEVRIHLGDAYDTRALRSGAKGTSDESAPIGEDLQLGREFLWNFRPTVFTEGNHDFRPRALMEHHNTIIAECAKSVFDRMMEPLRDMKTEWYPWNIWKPYELGGYKFFHGVLYGENYLRDTANRFGNSVVAHAHRAGISKGVRVDNPTAFGVGTLADIEAMEYAAQRTSTLAWSHAMVYGEICEDKASLHLHEWPKGEAEWRLPV